MRIITCVLVIAAFVAIKADQEYAGVRVAMKVYDECSKADSFSPCLKKKAFTILDRLGRMEKLSIADGVTVVRAADAPAPSAPVTEEDLDKNLPRSADARDAALNDMLVSKVASLVGSRTVQISFPEVNSESISRGIEEGRGKMKKMMGGMMMGIAAKMAALVPVAIAGLFLLAGKALITAKIALLISGIIALKKLLAKKEHGHGGGHGHGGFSGGGFDKRAFDEAQKLAYKGYAPQ